MAQRLVADLMVERLHAWQVPRIFGYSGDGINTFMGALRRAGTVEFVQARHEESAAFMAVGHAKYTGGVGVVTSTQGPGAVHLLNNTDLCDGDLDRGQACIEIVEHRQRQRRERDHPLLLCLDAGGGQDEAGWLFFHLVPLDLEHLFPPRAGGDQHLHASAERPAH